MDFLCFFDMVGLKGDGGLEDAVDFDGGKILLFL